MHDREVVAEALRLKARGLNDCDVARRIGVPRPTVRDWATGKLPHSFQPKAYLYGRPVGPDACPACASEKHRFGSLPAEYVYLLGLYLGDGCLSVTKKGVYRLRIALDMRYPQIVEECATSMRAVMPHNIVSEQLTPKNYVEVHGYSKSWPCLFPQHGPGRKHERAIRLVNWQQRLIYRFPKLLLRGLIHSDGCRFMNSGRRGWRYPRYSFSNRSEEIHGIFCDACDVLGVHWTTAPHTVYVSRKADVDYLDTFIGAKR